MLSMSMGSWLIGRRRKKRRSPVLKLFSRCFAFMMISDLFNPNRQGPGHHAAAAGFCRPSFEGAQKRGATGAELVKCYPDYLRSNSVQDPRRLLPVQTETRGSRICTH